MNPVNHYQDCWFNDWSEWPLTTAEVNALILDKTTGQYDIKLARSYHLCGQPATTFDRYYPALFNPTPLET